MSSYELRINSINPINLIDSINFRVFVVHVDDAAGDDEFDGVGGGDVEGGDVFGGDDVHVACEGE